MIPTRSNLLKPKNMTLHTFHTYQTVQGLNFFQGYYGTSKTQKNTNVKSPMRSTCFIIFVYFSLKEVHNSIKISNWN